MQQAARTDVYKYSIFRSVVKLWNSLPGELVNAKAIDNLQTVFNLLIDSTQKLKSVHAVFINDLYELLFVFYVCPRYKGYS